MRSLFRRHRWAALAGLIWGLLAPLAGVFIGLAVNTTLGTLLTLPWIALAALTDQAMLELPLILRLFAVFISGIAWSAIFAAVAAMVGRR